MRHRYLDLVFTPAVCTEQESHSSRAAYATAADGEAGPDTLTQRERGFFAARDTFLLASVSETGWPYVQHRGGPRGFVRTLDDSTIRWAEFAGNRQHVSTGNTNRDDQVALLFVDVALQWRLKLLGHLRLYEPGEQPDLALRLALDGYEARVERFAVVAVEGLDWNCPQHIAPRFTADEFAAAATTPAVPARF